MAHTAAWDARYTSYYLNDAENLVHLIGDDSGSYAWLTENGRGWEVTESGPRRIWSEVEAAVTRWEQNDRPPQDRYTITITPDGKMTIGPPI